MSIANVTVEHYRSIKHCALNFDDINLLIGENGTGKSNILDAIRHFYDCLLRENDDPSCYNFQNRFSNEFSISLTFDFRHLKQISKRKQFYKIADHRIIETLWSTMYDTGVNLEAS